MHFGLKIYTPCIFLGQEIRGVLRLFWDKGVLLGLLYPYPILEHYQLHFATLL